MSDGAFTTATGEGYPMEQQLQDDESLEDVSNEDDTDWRDNPIDPNISAFKRTKNHFLISRSSSLNICSSLGQLMEV